MSAMYTGLPARSGVNSPVVPPPILQAKRPNRTQAVGAFLFVSILGTA